MGLSGNLKTVSFPDILQLLATGKKTGILECRTTSRQKEVAFRGGNIIYASSVNNSEDLLGNMLLGRGKISKGDLERAITLHKQTGRQLGTTLIDMNLFDKEEIAECLKLQIEEIVYNLFSWQEGDFAFREGEEPKRAPFLIEMSTMSVVMEGTRRIDEWLEIQKILPPDDIQLQMVVNPKLNNDEVRLSLDEFRMLTLIDGKNTLPELVKYSPMGEFVTYRAVYKLILSKLVEGAGRKEGTDEVEVNEDEVILKLIFFLYNNCLFKVRSLVDQMVGEDNTRFASFAAQYRTGLMTFFPGVDPKSDLMPPVEKFIAAVMAIPAPLRMHKLLGSLQKMLSEQLVFVYQLLGSGPFQSSLIKVKREIAEPLARDRELVKRYDIESTFYATLKQADKIVRMVRG